MDEVPSPTGLSTTAEVVPIAAIGSLSQAWFDALGLARPKQAQTQGKSAVSETPQRAAKAPEQLGAMTRNAMPQMAQPAVERKDAGRPRLAAETLRIGAAEKLKARSHVHASLATANDAMLRSAGRITIRSKHGIIKMLVQRDHDKMRITAVCDPAVVGSVTDALATARIRLAARGVIVSTSAHEGQAA